jgi:hypothetical protein
MSNRISTIRPSLDCVTFLAAALLAAGPLHAQTKVEVIATALHHVSVVQVPEPVENVALGSAQVHVEWHGNNILIEPQRTGVDTNMVVFTHRTTYLYEIAAASEPGAMSWLVKENSPAPPPPPLVPSPSEVQTEHDRLFASLILASRNVDTSGIHPKKHSVVVRVVQVSEDAHNYYVRLSATNNTSHTYRLQNAAVMKIDPAFGGDIAYQNVNHQIGADVFKEFRKYQQTPVVTHGSTLDITDMPPDTTMDWVEALSKPGVTPAIFRWTFAADQGAEIDAVAIF